MKQLAALIFAATSLHPAPIAAQTQDTLIVAQNRTYQDVVASLEYTGYVVDSITRTLFGRIKITASNQSHTREVVVSRNTGEILSDSIVSLASEDAGSSELELGISGTVSIGINR